MMIILVIIVIFIVNMHVMVRKGFLMMFMITGTDLVGNRDNSLLSNLANSNRFQCSIDDDDDDGGGDDDEGDNYGDGDNCH